jgi:hypothetical protein
LGLFFEVDQKFTISYNVVIVNNKEQLMNIPDYQMYTDAGNHAVDAIVRSAQILKMSWPQVHKELRSLAQRFPKDFGEATDTAVRECVYDTLKFTESFYGE